jgi:hypothetical protein
MYYTSSEEEPSSSSESEISPLSKKLQGKRSSQVSIESNPVIVPKKQSKDLNLDDC